MGVLDFRAGWRGRFPSLKRRLSFLLRVLLGLLFVVSGLGKVSNLAAFHRELVLYAFLPAWSLPVLAVAIPAVEYFLGACLVLGMWLRRVVPILAGLLVVFSGALVYRIAAGATGSCGCFGGMLPEFGGWWALVRNGVLLFCIWFLSGAMRADR